ncbi:hypothetical protein BD413DRAFT_502826 [Trametes elegans]|nr:hypothetical protein BD413DRAFT_502826 [Trametes elegans]
MGSAASKSARKLPKTPPAWAGARTPNPAEQAPLPRSTAPRASETRSEAIERDSGDPHFMANLNRLGQVKVDHHMQTIKPAAHQAQRLFQARLRSEDEAARPPHNLLLASSLWDVLEERKYATTREELEKIAKRYDVDLDKLERLARYVNSVSVHPDSVRREVDDEGVERVTLPARWVNPKIAQERPLLG